MNSGACESYCEHGGQCALKPGHEEKLHDSSYCQWTDAQALTRAQANAVLSGKPGGDEQILIEDLFYGSGEEE